MAATLLSRRAFLVQHVTTTTPLTSEPECSICLEAYNTEHHAVTFSDPLSCNHIFGASCLCKWLCRWGVNNCPICRRVLFKLDYAEEEEDEEVEIEMEIEMEREISTERVRHYQHIEPEEPPSVLAFFFQVIPPLIDMVHRPVAAAPPVSAMQWPFSLNPFIQIIPHTQYYHVSYNLHNLDPLSQEHHIEQEDTRPATNQKAHWLDRFFQVILPLSPLACLPFPAAPHVAVPSQQEQEREDTRPLINPNYVQEDTSDRLSAVFTSIVERAYQRAADARLAINRLQDQTPEFLPYSSMR